jgi:hypothetical protein
MFQYELACPSLRKHFPDQPGIPGVVFHQKDLDQIFWHMLLPLTIDWLTYASPVWDPPICTDNSFELTIICEN